MNHMFWSGQRVSHGGRAPIRLALLTALSWRGAGGGAAGGAGGDGAPAVVAADTAPVPVFGRDVPRGVARQLLALPLAPLQVTEEELIAQAEAAGGPMTAAAKRRLGVREAATREAVRREADRLRAELAA
jgi:hypothetical protein